MNSIRPGPRHRDHSTPLEFALVRTLRPSTHAKPTAPFSLAMAPFSLAMAPFSLAMAADAAIAAIDKIPVACGACARGACGVYFDGSVVEDNALDWTIVEYAGSSEIGSGLGQAGLGLGGFVGDANASVTNSTFRHIDGHGIEVESESKLTAFSKNTFEDTDDFALSIPAHQRGQIDAETVFVDADEIAGIEVYGQNVSSDQVWGPLK